ncbi:LPS export ABC transporter permease LptG [Yoonia sp. 208BN28-4]|uniref:LPS export ABC transporter permease LptG n=1 Tax=Yoonia sp. 208BN28-4 TaxID=3126505 RepID=UPI0030B1C8E8
MILHRYFARRFTFSFLGVFAVFVMILTFIDFVDQLRRYANADASLAEIAVLTLLQTPESIYGILPLIMILATITLFLGLARSSELVVTRAAGRSGLRALMAPLVVAFLIGVLAVAVMNPIVAATQRQAEARIDALKGESSVLSLGSTGLWLRQGNDDQQTVIQADSANLDGTELNGVTFISFDRTVGPIQRIEAARAELVAGAWVATNAKLWPLSGNTTPEAAASLHPQLTIPSTLTADQIRDSFGTPSSIPIWDLPQFIDRLRAAGFSAQRHEVWFQMELAMPAFMAAMMLIGAAFTMRHQRGGRVGLMVLMAIMFSFAIYFLRNFAQILGENGQLPAALAAWAPPLAAIGLSLGFLLHQEDG